MEDRTMPRDTLQKIVDLDDIETDIKVVLLRLNRLLPKRRIQDLDNIESLIWIARMSALNSLDEVGMAKRMLRDGN